MIGDPSFKTDERNLLDEETLNKNIEGIKSQLSKFINTDNGEALMLNNHDWISYDFYHLYKNHNCTLQMGGSDQWGNITTGTELVRRMGGGKAFAISTPLITKADGSKFGKSQSGNIWMNPELTSPYKFYQFWLNRSDDEAEEYIKKFTFLDKETVFALIAEHKEEPHLRLLQKRLAEEVTTMVHSKEDLDNAIEASGILFGKATFDVLNNLTGKELSEIFEGVPSFEIEKSKIEEGIDIVDFLSGETGILSSNGEARRSLKENAISINKAKVALDT
eukprot:maker-scaffold2519_size14888-snap-gene-0.0 protein:Tk04499 transcript:maker-scaffold2519_size14888-snap-gene-0.0-mRNA-1 annotation:"tyrosyl-trna synthetase"